MMGDGSMLPSILSAAILKELEELRPQLLTTLHSHLPANETAKPFMEQHLPNIDLVESIENGSYIGVQRALNAGAHPNTAAKTITLAEWTEACGQLDGLGESALALAVMKAST